MRLKGGIFMQLFDVLKARAGLPVDDPFAVLFAKHSMKPTPPVAAEHYGIRWRKTPSSSPTIEYLYDAENFTPVTMTNDGVSLGDWTNAFFVRNNYPVMCRFDGTEDYRLDPLDHTKKLDGTASDVTNESYAGNAMSCFDCHIWMKFWEDEDDDGWNYVEVSNRQLDENFVDYPYIRANGTHAEKLYYPMFEGRIVDGKLRSIGTGYATNYTTPVQFDTAAKATGQNWMIGDWHHHMWMLWLHTMMAKSFIFKNGFGRGRYGNPGNILSNGSCMSRGQFYGSDSTADAVKSFYCENLWGNHWKNILGIIAENPGNGKADYYIKQAPPYTTDGTHDDYVYCGKGIYTQGAITAVKATPIGFIPSESSSYDSGWARHYCNSGGGAICATGFCEQISYNYAEWTMSWVLNNDSYWGTCCSVYLKQPEVSS